MYLIDTNILIYYLAGEIPEKEKNKINKIFREDFNISVISKMEFLGFQKHTDESLNIAKRLVEYANIIGLTDDVVEEVISIKIQKKLKLPDAIIGATCKVGDLILVTRNDKDFDEVDVKIYNPFK